MWIKEVNQNIVESNYFNCTWIMFICKNLEYKISPGSIVHTSSKLRDLKGTAFFEQVDLHNFKKGCGILNDNLLTEERDI